jgi:pimeloyl-ACP methyl ester carboxylesterase
MIVLLHGWGFGPEVWDGVEVALQAYGPTLPPRQRLDLGYFGPAALNLPQGGLLVGHSYGALWLLQNSDSAVPLLAVNGFARFCCGDGQAEGTPPRLLARMRARLGEDPQGTLDAFRARCGAGPAAGQGRPDALAEGLAALQDARATLVGRRLFALAGADDPIVPPALALTPFGGDPLRDLVAGGGHMLPLTHPQAVAAAILRALGTQ